MNLRSFTMFNICINYFLSKILKDISHNVFLINLFSDQKMITLFLYKTLYLLHLY